MLKKIKSLIDRTLYISKLTAVNKKKLRIFFSVAMANVAVLFDIYIIVIFSNLITKEITFTNTVLISIIEFTSKSVFLLPLIVVLRFSFLFLERMNLELLNLDVQKNLRNYLMEEVYKLGNMSISDIYFYVNQVGTQVSMFYKSFALLLNSLLQVLGYSIFLLITDLNTFSIFLIGGLIISVPSRYFLKRGKFYQHKTFNESKRLNSTIQRIVENVFLIKILSTYQKEFDRLNDALQKFRDNQKLNTVFGTVNSILPSFFTIFTLSVIFVNFEISNYITLEFIAILTRLFQSLGNLSTGLGLVLNSSVHVGELYKLDRNKPDIKRDSYLLNTKLTDAVNFKNVTFKYVNSELPIFEDLNLKIKKNTHTVITGANGSGKSTLLGLIAGLYIPNKGSSEVYSDKIGYVGVTPLVFEGSLRENLLYGNQRKVEDEEIIKLLNEFNFYNNETVYDLNNMVSNRSLSSGQLQKVSFIRSLLNESDLLLLDESTSNLDVESKKLIFKILNSKNITIINSTHNIEDFNYDNHIKISLKNGKRQFS